ncbi:MAG: IMPACT family protein [Bacteroidales bacterium]|jgi:uncharacterized YigZ family protein|nr:IMPACT family protein [Bacteroidales bacterium]
MQQSSYKTITQPSEGLFKEKGSKFFAFAYPVASVAEIKPFIENLRKEHHSARHVCWAYKLGYDGSEYRANDDGEPNNSAGKPILGQIDSFELTNVLVCVVRYFGGTLLGVGGLIQAYKEAAREALSAAEIVEKPIEYTVTLRFDYAMQVTINQLLKQYNARTVSQKFELDCEFVCAVPVLQKELFLQAVRQFPNIVISE